MAKPIEDGVETVKLSTLKRAKNGIKFTGAQREEHRSKIAALRLRGYEFREIAREMELSLSYVYTEYKVVELRWRKAAHDDLATQKAKELAHLDAVEKEAWEAYERSRKHAVEQQEKSGYVGKERVPKETRAKQKTRDGDPRFLSVVMQCIDRRIKLLGLDNPDLQGVRDVAASNDGPLESRLARYKDVLGVAIVGVAVNPALGPHSGEPVDSARSAPEAGPILDVDGFVRETT